MSVRRTNLPTAGPGKARVLGPSTINAPNQPICSARYAPSAEPALLSCSPLATPRPCNSISTKSQPSYPRRTCHSHVSIKPDGTAQRPQGSQEHHAPVAAAACARAQPSRKYLAVHAGELAVKPHLKSFDDIVDHCCYAWNTLIDQPWKIMSIARRDWAVAEMTLSDGLIAAIDSHRRHSNLSSALRLFVLDFYCRQVSQTKEVHAPH